MILNVTSGGNEDYYSLMVHTNSNAEVVVENKYDTYTKTADKIGSAAFCVTEGIWNVTSTKDGESKTVSINVVEDNILDMIFNYSPEFEYGGEYEVINEGGVNWHIKFKTSGTLNFTSLNNAVDGVEVFLVGGGGRGENAVGGVGGGSGGAGGSTKTESVTLVRNTDYQITIGGSGGETSGFGYTASSGKAGAGGSAGLETPDCDGGDGSNGKYAFNDKAYARYGAEGGGGCGAWDGAYGRGGSGGDYGGGKGGGANSNGGSGKANTGGGGGGGGLITGTGGAGGSGIIIIRNKRS